MKPAHGLFLTHPLALALPQAPIRVQEVARQQQVADRAELKAMFPQFDDDIIASVYGSANGNLDAAAAQLLSLQE